MFTVCPKCALTLVVTAADLRVAQGYVRCGRCSNVFNALARLSEDRTGATTQASAPKPPQSPPRSEVSGTFRTKAPPDADSSTAREPDVAANTKASATSKNRQPEVTVQTRAAQDASASAKLRQPAASPPAPAPTPASTPPPSPAPEPKRYDDDSIVEEDLEFKPGATDINKVFVEQAPSPKFTAATGTFKSLKLEAESAARAADELARTGERKGPAPAHFDPVNTQVDVEIDPDLLATMAQLTSNRLERLNPPPEPEAPQPKPTMVLQPPEQPSPPPASMKLAERAKARAEAAKPAVEAARASDFVRAADVAPRPDQSDSKPKADSQRASALETSQALRDALAPRKRRPETTPIEQPTSLFAGMWAAGSVVLLILLFLQIVHHYRHDLAANAALNGPLTSIYAALGIPIVPRWDLTAYEVRQLGASTGPDAPGQITVRASVKNTGHQAQPLPFLRVTLQDRFGNRIASRDVPPQSYLPRAIPRSSLLSAGQRIDAEMAFVDPGANAVGFEIDACLPAPGGGIACSTDAAR